MAIAADGRDLYRNVVLPIDLPDDRWITAIDYQPSARSVVHHALYFTAPAGTTVGDDEVVPGIGGLAGRLGGGGLLGLLSGRGAAAGRGRGGAPVDQMAPSRRWVSRRCLGRPRRLGAGATPRFFPDGIAQPLPKQTNLIIQLHLHPSGKAERENGEIAIYFAKTPPRRSLTGVQVPPGFGVGMGIDIPAGEPRYIVRDAFVLPVDVEAFGVRGHAHYLCKEMKMTATLPDGSTRGLLWIKDWDFSWQDSYFFKAAVPTAEGHAHRHRAHLRQLGGQHPQPVLAAAARPLGPRIDGRNGQHDAARDHADGRRRPGAADSAGEAPARADRLAVAGSLATRLAVPGARDPPARHARSSA